MNVYWFGTEDIDFTLTGTAVFGTGGGSLDPLWVRSSLNLGVTSTTWPLTTSGSNASSFGNLSSFWAHASVCFQTTATASGNISFAFADNAGVGRILIRGTGTAGQLKISSRNAAGTITDFSGAVTAAGAYTAALSKVDFFINYSTSGQIQMYINGALAADTGAGVNVTTDSATSLSYIYFSAPSTNFSQISQVIIADSDTRAASLWLMNSSTAGNAQTFSGTASNVNKAFINDSTVISAASAGLINEYRTGGIALPAGTFTVAAVRMVSRAQIGSGGPQHVEYVTRVGSTDYVGGSWSPPTGAFGNDTQNYMQATNPATGIAWTTSDLTATTFNYGVESVA